MRYLDIQIEGANRAVIAYDLRELAKAIEYGYASGITCTCGTAWALDGNDEEDDEEDDTNQ
ncbi:MAG: hypothetical protein IKD17_08345 [Alistipes sp.]|nr:hypothetical protein [Alistipes sp.]